MSAGNMRRRHIFRHSVFFSVFSDGQEPECLGGHGSIFSSLRYLIIQFGESPVIDTTKTADDVRIEMTLRGLILGVIITIVFTAANVFFGLKAGLTFATSIPAAVISMALLRNFKNSTIQENNIVQTVASAAGTLSSIIFVLPGLIMIGWWTEFPFWISFFICALGGILGVMYS